ncbi:MAG: CRISPR-associated protein Cas4, partial [Rectinemataceae bacterium]|nr:CRISPR-associated protein Cas4 [Rectinemataceae bacterium]
MIVPANDASEEEMIPLDAVHQFAYCPRRAYLMHHDGRWDDNEYTAEGRLVHRRVDENEDVLVEPSIGNDEPPRVSRSVSLGSITLGISAKLDLVETDKNEAVPVETKRGKVPDNPERSWEPERVQLMVQGLLLRESGYHCNRGILYFSGSR